MDLIAEIKRELETNKNKLSPAFINSIASHRETKVSHAQITPNTRVCVVTLPSGHDLVGYAQVLDKNNDVELVGQEVAYTNAIKKLWSTCGTIAKTLL